MGNQMLEYLVRARNVDINTTNQSQYISYIEDSITKLSNLELFEFSKANNSLAYKLQTHQYCCYQLYNTLSWY